MIFHPYINREQIVTNSYELFVTLCSCWGQAWRPIPASRHLVVWFLGDRRAEHVTIKVQSCAFSVHDPPTNRISWKRCWLAVDANSISSRPCQARNIFVNPLSFLPSSYPLYSFSSPILCFPSLFPIMPFSSLLRPPLSFSSPLPTPSLLHSLLNILQETGSTLSTPAAAAATAHW